MKQLSKVMAFLIANTAFIVANPAFMGGFTYKFGGSNGLENAGATLKVVSSDEDKKAVVTAGVSYFPWAKSGKKYGLDIGAGYNVNNATISGGWDFLQNQPTVSLGYTAGVSDDDDLVVVDDKTSTTSCSEESN